MNRKKIISLGIAVVMVLQLFTVAFADDGTPEPGDLTQFITDVRLFNQPDGDDGQWVEIVPGVPDTGPIPLGGKVKLAYSYELPTGFNPSIPAAYQLQVPEQFTIDPLAGQITFGDKNVGNWNAGDRDVKVNFTESLFGIAEKKGTFEFISGFNGSDETGQETISFPISENQIKVITVNYVVPEPEPIVVVAEKKGVFNATAGTVTWTIDVDLGDRPVKGVVIKDTLDANQSFVGTGKDIVTITRGGISPEDYEVEVVGQGLKIKFEEGKAMSGKLTLALTTKVLPGAYTAGDSKVTNKAQVEYNGGQSDEASDEVDVTIAWIKKEGVQSEAVDPATGGEYKTITWIIKVNEVGRAITNAKVTDTLPAGLVPIDGSAEWSSSLAEGATWETITESPFIYIEESGRWELSHSFGEINSAHFLRFKTKASADTDLSYYTNGSKSFSNSVDLSIDGGTVGTGSKTVTVTSSVISKTKHDDYDKATQTVGWEIVVNRNKVAINDASVTDTIPKGQEYVAGSFYVDNASVGDPTITSGSNESTTFTYNFTGQITGTHVIRFRTRVTDPAIYGSNKFGEGQCLRVENAASLTGTYGDGETRTQEAEATQPVCSKIFSKTNGGYDFETRILTWDIVVNEYAVPLSNVVFTDYIPQGQEFVSMQIGDNQVTEGEAAGQYRKSGNAQAEGGTVITYSFGDITTVHKITLKTRIVDLSIFDSSGNKTLRNRATLEYSGAPGIEVEAEKTIPNTLVDKTGTHSYLGGDPFTIGWKVALNPNQIPITDVIVTDKIVEGLELAEDTLAITELKVNAVGGLETVKTLEIDRATRTFKDNSGKIGSYDYGYGVLAEDPDQRYLVIHLPTPTQSAYRIEYKTDIIVSSGSHNFKNEVKLTGTGTDSIAESGSKTIAFSAGSASFEGKLGNIIIVKVAALESLGEEKLPGAVFELRNEFGHLLRTSDPTGVDGKTAFEQLKFDTTYFIEEITAPEFYQLDPVRYGFRLKWKSGATEIEWLNGVEMPFNNGTLTWPNETIKGSVELKKVNRSNRPLAGGQFTIYHANDVKFEHPLATERSGQDGLVLFTDLEVGEYVIRETRAPAGYAPSKELITATVVLSDGTAPVQATPYEIVNTWIDPGVSFGAIELMKTDAEGKVLAGAEFTLYDSRGEALQVAVSDAAGLVRFNNVLLGSYTIRETKAPEGYETSVEVLTATVSRDGEVVRTSPYTVVNEKTDSGDGEGCGSIELRKVDDNDEPLAGAEFTLYDSEGEVVQIALSDADGMVRFEKVSLGSYTIQETKAPEGYEALTFALPVTVAVEGEEVHTNPYTVINTKLEDPSEPGEPGDPGDPDEPIGDGNTPGGPGKPGDKEPTSPESELPKAGGFLDTSVLILGGVLLILAGLGYALMKRKARNSVA